jgi:alpha-N-arabinofuranosidase
MKAMDRRQFVIAGLGLLAPRTSRAASARIEILPDEPIGVISPNIYGHFTEHLGGCIYDGIWVGENSPVPNIGGIRKALVDNLKRLKPPVIRWPGGCFADSYNWRDGVGPRAQRPKRTNFWADTPYLAKAPDGPFKVDPNLFGTNEFVRFCKLAGAEPYLAANLRSLPAHDFYQWIEYCNSPAGSTSLAQLRAAGGDTQPFPVQFWGVGNESWGCGGNFTGDEYAVEFRRFVEWVPRFGTPLSFIASGPNGPDYAWTRSFFSKLVEKSKGPLRSVYGTALHYYCGTSGKGDAVDFTVDDWYSLLAKANRMEDLIRKHWEIMGDIDTERKVKLIVDEWGAWHQTADIAPGYLFGYFPTLRDALVSGITLDIFNRHADKVAMANAAQLVNNIHSSFLAAGERFTVTPIFHVFEMYAAHQGGTSLRTEVFAPRLNAESAKGLPSLAGSCSIHGKRLVLTIVNPDDRNSRDTEINVRGGQLTPVAARVLTSPDIHAHNTFDHPNALEPVDQQLRGATYQFPPASVTRLEFDLS